MKKIAFIFTILFCSYFHPSKAQKLPVYGEFGLGIGQTLFFGDTKTQLRNALGGSFDPGIVNNLMMAFYYSPEKWRGLGIGLRIKGSIATSVDGDFGDSYFFNYYNLGVTAKYYPFGGSFNKGLYARAALGFGQLTSKRANDEQRSFTHQFAIGSTMTGGIGYSFPIRKSAMSLEAEFESSSRNGTVDGFGDQNFRSGQVGVNLIYSF